MNRAADYFLLLSDDFLCHIIALPLRMFSCIRVSRKTNTTACRNSTVSPKLSRVASPSRRRTIGITQLIGKGIFRYFGAPLKKYYQHVRNAVLAVCAKPVPVCGKRGETRGYYWKKNYLDMPFVYST